MRLMNDIWNGIFLNDDVNRLSLLQRQAGWFMALPVSYDYRVYISHVSDCTGELIVCRMHYSPTGLTRAAS